MSLYVNSSADIALMLTAAAGATVAAADVVLSGVKAHDGSVSTHNTEVWVTMNASNASLQGRAKVYYDRLNLRDLGNFQFISQSASAGASIYTILDIIRNQTGITFTSDDLVETFVTDNGTSISIQLTAKTTSLGFTGSFTLILKNYPNISTLFSNNVLVGF